MKRRIAIAVAALIGLSTAVISPANAASDLEKVLRLLGGYSDTYSGGTLVPNQATVQANVNTGLTNLAAQISAGVSSGQLTLDEQATLNAELNRLRSLHTSYMVDGGYSAFEVETMLSGFNSMNSLLATNLNNGINIAGSTTTSGNLYMGDYNSVINLRNSLRTRINTAVANGDLTVAEANMLRAEFNRISSQLNRRTLRGNLNYNPLVRRLTALDHRVTQMIDDNRYAGGNWWF